MCKAKDSLLPLLNVHVEAERAILRTSEALRIGWLTFTKPNTIRACRCFYHGHKLVTDVGSFLFGDLSILESKAEVAVGRY